MSAQVQKLETLLARVQENRSKPRAVAPLAKAAPSAPSAPEKTAAAPAAARPAPVAPKAPSEPTIAEAAARAVPSAPDRAAAPARPVVAEPVEAPAVQASGPVAVSVGTSSAPRPRTLLGLVERSLELRVRG